MAKKSLVVGNKPTSSDVRLAPELDEDIVAGTPRARVGVVVEATVLAAAEAVAAGGKSDSDFSSPPPQAEISKPRTNSTHAQARYFFHGLFFK